MDAHGNTRPIVLMMAGALAWVLAGCGGTTTLVTPTIPPDPTSSAPTSAQPTVAPPTPAPTQPDPDVTLIPTEPTTVTTQPSPDPTPPGQTPDPGVRYALREAPQLGSDPVRGSGCGLDGSIGETMPDGWWYGFTSDWNANTFQFDMACVYSGEAAQPFIDECRAGPDGDLCLEYGSPDFWVENRSQRTRTVPYSPAMEIVVQDGGGCPGYDARQGGMLALVQIINGVVTYVVTSCPAN